MKYEIKQLNDTDAVVTIDEEIREDWIFYSNRILKVQEYNSNGVCKYFIKGAIGATNLTNAKKVIATISPYKIEGLPMLELDNKNQESCNFCGKTVREQMKGCNEITCYRQFLSNQEEDIEKLAEHSSEVQEGTYTTQHKITYKHGFIDGYKAAQKQYSE